MGPQRDDSVTRVTVLQATGPEFRYQHSYTSLGVVISFHNLSAVGMETAGDLGLGGYPSRSKLREPFFLKEIKQENQCPLLGSKRIYPSHTHISSPNLLIINMDWNYIKTIISYLMRLNGHITYYKTTKAIWVNIFSFIHPNNSFGVSSLLFAFLLSSFSPSSTSHHISSSEKKRRPPREGNQIGQSKTQ